MEQEMEQENAKNYYAIIPAKIRYDKDLSANAKLLYGEIYALAKDKGFCWATNQYFADLYSVSKVSISKWIKLLIDKGYIQSEILYKEGTKEIKHRILKIVDDPIKEKFNTLLKKSLIPYLTKVNYPIKEKFKGNNTINNTIKNKEKNIYKKRKTNFEKREYETLENLYDNFEGGE